MKAVLIALAAAAALQAGPPIRTLDKGDQSNVDDALQAVARTATEWNTLWRQHAPDRPMPKVDLGRDMVVGVFMGSRPTAGFGVDITAIREEGGKLVVTYRETLPARGMISAQVITSAYHIVAIPSRSGAVTFERAQ